MANDADFSQSERASAVIAGLGGKDNLERWTAAPRVLASTVKNSISE